MVSRVSSWKWAGDPAEMVFDESRMRAVWFADGGARRTIVGAEIQ